MDKRGKLYEFLINPPLWLCIIVWTVEVLLIVACITLYFLGLGLQLWAVAVYAVALAFFLLSTYCVLSVVGVTERAKNCINIRKFFSDYGFRAYVYAFVSAVFNAAYIVCGVIIAVVTKSHWLGVLVGYHVVIAVARTVVILTVKNHTGNGQAYRLRAYTYSGGALMLLSLAIIPVIKLVVEDENTYTYFLISAIAYVCVIALYAFIKLGVAIYNLKRVHKYHDMSLYAIKNISFADALITLFALQATMLKEFGNIALGSVLNPVLGGTVSLAIFIIGSYMFGSGIAKLKELKSSGYDNEPTEVQNGEMPVGE